MTAPTTIRQRVTIKELFDFSCPHWAERYVKQPMRSFDEELALYELLDMNADGEADVDVDVDDMTGDILLS